jgi:hypothetical protein
MMPPQEGQEGQEGPPAMPDEHARMRQARNIPPDAPAEILEEIVDNEYPTYAKIGLIVGGIVVTAGGVMIKVGLAGPADLTIHIGGSEMHLSTLVVGVVIAVIGAVIFIVTRPGLFFAKKDRKG